MADRANGQPFLFSLGVARGTDAAPQWRSTAQKKIRVTRDEGVEMSERERELECDERIRARGLGARLMGA
jgi:hypothetical protein